VIIEFYRIFPLDSTVPPDGRVPTRDNSPSDVAFSSRDSGSGELTFSASLLNSSFTAGNSVLNGIHPLPTVFTGGEGPITGQEVQLSFSVTSDMLAAGHYFFVPQVELSTGDFFWLSAPKPISGSGTTPFPPGVADLQTWTRNEDLQPDWLRVGTDITHQGPFNASFSLNGEPVPEPCTAAGGRGLARADSEAQNHRFTATLGIPRASCDAAGLSALAAPYRVVETSVYSASFVSS
jgi:hypothetical protein